MWLSTSSAKVLRWVGRAVQATFETLYNKCKCIILNKIQEVLFTLEVVVEAGEGKAEWLG